MNRNKHRSQRNEQRRQQQKPVFLQTDPVDVTRERDKQQPARKTARVQNHQRLHRRLEEHIVDVGVRIIIRHPGRTGSGDVQRPPSLRQELGAGQADTVVPEIQQEPTHGCGCQNPPISLGPKILFNIVSRQSPRRVKCGQRRGRNGPGRSTTLGALVNRSVG